MKKEFQKFCSTTRCGVRVCVYTQSMTTTAATIEIYNMRTGKVIRTFTNRKTATAMCRCYNDMANRNAFNTRTTKAGN